MNKRERVAAVIAGRQPDRPPVSFWYHFEPAQAAGRPAVEAHLLHLETYDLDFLKVMDDNRYPRIGLPEGVIDSAADLERLSVLRGDEDSFGRQLELIGELARRLAGQVPMVTTIFNPWATIRHMTVADSGLHGPPTLVRGEGIAVCHQDVTMARLLREAPGKLARALEVVAESSANFARRCLDAGADGVYLSVRDDWVDSPEREKRREKSPEFMTAWSLGAIWRSWRRRGAGRSTCCTSAARPSTSAASPAIRSTCSTGRTDPRARRLPRWPAGSGRRSAGAWTTSRRWSPARPTTAPPKWPTPCVKPARGRFSSAPAARLIPPPCRRRTSARSARRWNAKGL